MALKRISEIGDQVKTVYESLPDSLLKEVEGRVSTLENNALTDASLVTQDSVKYPDLERENVIFVFPDPEDGTPEGDGSSWAKPLFSIKTAVESAPNGTLIKVGAGIYAEDYPINVKNTDISVVGEGLRATIIRPTNGTKDKSCFYCNSGFYVSGVNFEGHLALSYLPSKYNAGELSAQRIQELKRLEGAFVGEFPPDDLYRDDETGYDYVTPEWEGTDDSNEAKLDENGDPVPNPVAGETKRKIFKSPYFQNSTVFTQPEDLPVISYEDYEPGVQFNDGSYDLEENYSDRIAVAGSLDDDPDTPTEANKVYGGGGLKIDGKSPSSDSPIRSFVVDSFTQIDLDGIGCAIINDGYAQLVSFFGTFCYVHILTESGGICNLTNSTSDFGTYGLISQGKSPSPLFNASIYQIDPSGGTKQEKEKQYIYFDVLNDSYSLIDYDLKFVINGQETQYFKDGTFNLITAETSDPDISNDEELTNKIYNTFVEIDQRGNGIEFEDINIYGTRIELIYEKGSLTPIEIELRKKDTGELIVSNTSATPPDGFSGLIKAKEFLSYFPIPSLQLISRNPSGNRLRKGEIAPPAAGQSLLFNDRNYLNVTVSEDTLDDQTVYRQTLDGEIAGYAFTNPNSSIKVANLGNYNSNGNYVDPYTPSNSLDGVKYDQISEMFGMPPFDPIVTYKLGNARFDARDLIERNAIEKESGGNTLGASSGEGIVQKAYREIVSGSGSNLESNFDEIPFMENVALPLLKSVATQLVNQGNVFFNRAFHEVRDWVESKGVTFSNITSQLSNFVFGASNSLKALSDDAIKGQLSNPLYDGSDITQVGDPDNDSPCSDISNELTTLWEKVDDLITGNYNELITYTEKEFGKLYDASNLIEKNKTKILNQVKDNTSGSPWDQITNTPEVKDILSRNNDKVLKELIDAIAFQLRNGGNIYLYQIVNDLKITLYQEVGSLETSALSNAIALINNLISSIDTNTNPDVIDSRTLLGACIDAITINTTKGHQNTDYGVLIEHDINGEDKPLYRDIDGTNVTFNEVRCQSAISTLATYWEIAESILEDNFPMDQVKENKALPQDPPALTDVENTILDGSNILNYNRNEIVSFVSNNLGTVAPDFDASLFNNNSTKCSRDLKYFLDAVAWDMARNGNEKAVDYGRLSLEALKSQADSGANSLSYLQDEYSKLIDAVITEAQAVLDPEYHNGNNLPSRYGGSFPYSLPTGYPFDLTDNNNTDCASAKSAVNTLFEVIKSVLNQDSFTKTPHQSVLTQVKDEPYPDLNRIPFYNRSIITSGGHTMEYVGSGTDYRALPWFGGSPIEANETVERAGENGTIGRILATTQNQNGTLKINNGVFEVDGFTGETTFTSDIFNLSNLNAIGPFKRSGITVGAKLEEVSNNVELKDSIDQVRGRTTVPTQFAVFNYTENRLDEYTGRETIHTVGTITTGTWEATPITGQYLDHFLSDHNDVVQGNQLDGQPHGFFWDDDNEVYEFRPLGEILVSSDDPAEVGQGAEIINNMVLMDAEDYETNRANGDLDPDTLYILY